MPEDTGPLRETIAEIADRRVGAVLFTAALQMAHLLLVAVSEDCEAELHAALAGHTMVGSIGLTTPEAEREEHLPVDIEPAHPKMGHPVAAVAAGWRDVGKASAVGDP